MYSSLQVLIRWQNFSKNSIFALAMLAWLHAVFILRTKRTYKLRSVFSRRALQILVNNNGISICYKMHSCTLHTPSKVYYRRTKFSSTNTKLLGVAVVRRRFCPSTPCDLMSTLALWACVDVTTMVFRTRSDLHA